MASNSQLNTSNQRNARDTVWVFDTGSKELTFELETELAIELALLRTPELAS